MKIGIIFSTVILLTGTSIYAQSPESHTTPSASTLTAAGNNDRYATMGFSELLGLAKQAASMDEKMRISIALGKLIPKNNAEVTDALNFLDTLKDAQGDDLYKSAVKLSIRNLKDIKYGPTFADRINKGEYESRLLAIQKVAEFKYQKAVPELIKMTKGLTAESAQRMKPQEAYLKLNAFNALGDIGDETALPVVLEKLGKLNGRDAQVIAKYGAKVLPKLIQATKAGSEPERDSAYSAITAINDKEAVNLLWKTTKSTSDLRLKNAAIGALMKTTTDNSNPSKKEVSEYLAAEGNANKALRPQLMAIAKKNHDFETLIRIMNDKTPDNRGNRIYSIICLGEIKAAEAVPALKETLKDSDKEVRINAASALKQITGKDFDWKQN